MSSLSGGHAERNSYDKIKSRLKERLLNVFFVTRIQTNDASVSRKLEAVRQIFLVETLSTLGGSETVAWLVKNFLSEYSDEFPLLSLQAATALQKNALEIPDSETPETQQQTIKELWIKAERSIFENEFCNS